MTEVVRRERRNARCGASAGDGSPQTVSRDSQEDTGRAHAVVPRNELEDSPEQRLENGGCASSVDPIGTVFFDNGATGNAQTHIWQGAGWGGTVLEEEQYFASHGVCRLQDGANADDGISSLATVSRLAVA